MATKQESPTTPSTVIKAGLSHHPFFKSSGVLFYGLCALLDEFSTFSILALGGIELNPQLLLILGIHPLLWPLMDITLLLCFVALGRTLKFKRFCLLPLGAGCSRLLCFLWNVTQIVLSL